MITATVTTKGQITIPAAIRSVLQLATGDRIVFELMTTGGVSIKPVQKTPVTALKGMVAKRAKPVSIAEMNAVIAKRGAAGGLGLSSGSVK